MTVVLCYCCVAISSGKWLETQEEKKLPMSGNIEKDKMHQTIPRSRLKMEEKVVGKTTDSLGCLEGIFRPSELPAVMQ